MGMEKQKPREEAMERIENYILENKLKPDDKLPSERSMCMMWELNRTTLRSAIRQLTLEGKIYSKNGSGTYVSKKKLMKNLQDVEGFYQTALKAGREISTKVISVEVCETSKGIGQKMELPLGHKLLRVIRIRFLDEYPVMYETTYLDYERFPQLDEHINENSSLYEILGETYHLVITGGKEKLSIAYCDEKEACYLQVKEGDPVIYQSGIAVDDEGKIFEYFKSITRSEYVCFASELKRL
ncbi:GntR family transcriptional regulator [Anaerosacchariphilus polymeriproducens]|uniref:GntR family transcriptional regulator n=1 Tax=Anaerosacchariphilus polymeriproducens TaxID=1812858 RepID=A0A371AWA2_9FIRM|nr:GntR family transcriptional regulator [Anaerosacchariphilus polymeriproducens]RDU23843.1 GntR family transcriptional regulator [Anaerosacchariphilus polymeriproducens]